MKSESAITLGSVCQSWQCNGTDNTLQHGIYAYSRSFLLTHPFYNWRQWVWKWTVAEKNVIIGWEESGGNSVWVRETGAHDWGMRCCVLCSGLSSRVLAVRSKVWLLECIVWVSAESSVNRTNPSATDVRDDGRER